MLGFLNRLFSCPQSQYFQIDRQADAEAASVKIESLEHFYKASHAEIDLILKKDEDKKLVDKVFRMFKSALDANKMELAGRSYVHAYTLELHEFLSGFTDYLNGVTDRDNQKKIGNAIYGAYKKHYWAMRKDINSKLCIACYNLGRGVKLSTACYDPGQGGKEGHS